MSLQISESREGRRKNKNKKEYQDAKHVIHAWVLYGEHVHKFKRLEITRKEYL